MSLGIPPIVYEKYPSLKKFDQEGYEEWKGGREQALLKYIKQHPDFAQIQGNPTKLLDAMDDFACKQDFLIHIGSDKARIMNDLLSAEKPNVIVELGSYVGYSAILFAAKMRQLAGAGQTGKVLSLEFDPDFAAIATKFVAIAGLSDIVTVVTGPADESLHKLRSDDILEHIDLLFIDHVEDLYVQDLKVCEELGLSKQGACIVADNVVKPGAPKYREYVRNHSGLQSRGIRGLIIPGELEDELEVSKVL